MKGVHAMKKKLVMVILSLVLAFLPVFSVAGIAYAVPTVITAPDDTRIEAMLDAIGDQSFDEVDRTAEEARDLIAHFVFTSKFKAVGGGTFPYPNSSAKLFSTIDDGTYKKTIKGAKGCMAYARFVSKVIYDSEGAEKHKALYTADGFKTMLQTYGQAGDHIRSDNNHSLIFVSCTDEGFYTMDYVNLKNQEMQLAYWTYADFLNFKLYKGRKIFLFDANPSTNAVVDDTGDATVVAAEAVTGDTAGDVAPDATP